MRELDLFRFGGFTEGSLVVGGGGVAAVVTMVGLDAPFIVVGPISIPNTPEWPSLVGVTGSATSLAVSSSSSITVWHSCVSSSACGGPM